MFLLNVKIKMSRGLAGRLCFVWTVSSIYLHALRVVEDDLQSKIRIESNEYCKSKGALKSETARENCLPGSPSTEWDVNAGGDPFIQGFARPFSVEVGGRVEFRVKTVSRRYKIDIYRLGYYGGDGGRLVHTIPSAQIQFYGEQPECRIRDPETRWVDCANWKIGAVWDTSATAVVSGVYIARLVRQDVDDMPWTATWRGDASGKHASPLYGSSGPDSSAGAKSHPARDLIGKIKTLLPEQHQAGFSMFPFPVCNESAAEKTASLDCSAVDHAYGAQRRRDEPEIAPLGIALREPYASLIYFVVRKNLKKDGRNSDIVFQTSDTTWQAYNVWDSPNMYGRTPQGNCPHHNFTQWWTNQYRVADARDADAVKSRILNAMDDRANTSVVSGFNETFTSGLHGIGSEHDRRAIKKSYNVPFITRDLSLYNSVFNSEYPMIRFLEAHGYDVSYISGVDTHLNRNLGNGAKIILSVGHDEYWSSEQRLNVERIRDRQAGTHLAFFSGNEVFWEIRWEHSPLLFSEKSLGSGDPGADPDVIVTFKESQLGNLESFQASNAFSRVSSESSQAATSAWTGVFRDPRRAGADLRQSGVWPENALTGQITAVNALRNDPLYVPKRYAQHRFWRNTKLRSELKLETQAGVFLKGMLGHEWDIDWDNGYRPEGLMRLSETTVHNVHSLVDYAGTYDSATETHYLTLYKKKKDLEALDNSSKSAEDNFALVFGAGTCQFSWGLDPFHDRPTGTRGWENEQSVRVLQDLNGGAEPSIIQAVVNLFADMGNVQPQTLLGKSYGISHASSPIWSDSTTLFSYARTRVLHLWRSHIVDMIFFYYFEVALSAISQESSPEPHHILVSVEMELRNAAKSEEKKRWRPCQLVKTEVFRCKVRVDHRQSNVLFYKEYDVVYRGVDDLGNIETESHSISAEDWVSLINRETQRESTGHLPPLEREEL